MIAKTTLLFALTLSLCFAFVGCGEGDKQSTAKKHVESTPLMTSSKDQAATKDQLATKDGVASKDNQNPPKEIGKSGDQPIAKKSDGNENKQPTKDNTDPTKNAKALKDPDIEPTFVDPNNPDFVPPDRRYTEFFDLNDLKRVSLDAGDSLKEPSPVWTLASYVPGLGEPAYGVGDYGRGYAEIPFMLLAGFDYPTNLFVEAKPKEGEPVKPKPEIPYKVKTLNMRKVAIKGYMMPIDFEDGGTNEFILSRVIPSCFYCQPPQLNDWVEVRVKGGKRVPYFPDSPIVVYGRFEAGEMLEDGFVVNLYRVEADKVDEVVEP